MQTWSSRVTGVTEIFTAPDHWMLSWRLAEGCQNTGHPRLWRRLPGPEEAGLHGVMHSTGTVHCTGSCHRILASCHGNIMTGDDWKLEPPFDFRSAENFSNWKVSILRIWVFAHRQTWTCNNINIWQTKHFPLNFKKVYGLRKRESHKALYSLYHEYSSKVNQYI